MDSSRIFFALTPSENLQKIPAVVPFGIPFENFPRNFFKKISSELLQKFLSKQISIGYWKPFNDLLKITTDSFKNTSWDSVEKSYKISSAIWKFRIPSKDSPYKFHRKFFRNCLKKLFPTITSAVHHKTFI